MAQQGKSLIWIRHTAELPALPQHSQAFSAKLHIQVVYNAKERSTRWRGCDPGSHALLGAGTHWLCLWVCWVTSSLRTAVFFPKLQGVPHTHRGLRGCVCPLLKCTIIPCGALTLRVNTSKSPFLLQTTITCNFGPSVHVLMPQQSFAAPEFERSACCFPPSSRPNVQGQEASRESQLQLRGKR